MRAVLVSWHDELGIVLGSNNNPAAIFTYTGDMQKDAESFAKLCRYLQSIAPIMPPQALPSIKELPAYTEAQLANAQRFTVAGHAYGNGMKRKAPTVTNEALLDALSDIEL